MKSSKEDYEELLNKEKRRRKIKIYRDVIGILIIGGFSIYLYFFGHGLSYRMIVIYFSIAYIIIVGILLFRKLAKYQSLMDDLLIDKGDIIKYNALQRSEKTRISVDEIEKIHFNITDLPNTFYIVYKREGNAYAENFYKERIEHESKFYDLIEGKGLIDEEPISFQELKEEIEQSN